MKGFEHTTLKKSPEYVRQTIELIEGNLGYTNEYSFLVDFYPLMNKENRDNNHILIYEEKVIAHIGICSRNLKINGHKMPVGLLGGICVDKDHQGKGVLSYFLNFIIKKHEENFAYLMLWGNLSSLYGKFQFYEAGTTIQAHPPKPLDKRTLHHFKELSLKELGVSDLNRIKEIYNNQTDIISFERTEKDWKNILEINSTQLYVHRDEKGIIDGYFFRNKGQDLQGIIHEVGTTPHSQREIWNLLKDESVWAHQTAPIEGQEIFSAFFKISNLKKLNHFLDKITSSQLEILVFKENFLCFRYKDKKYETDPRTFLQLIHGPIEEKEFPFFPVYFSGLDSI